MYATPLPVFYIFPSAAEVCSLFHRVIGLAVIGAQPAVVPRHAKTVSDPLDYDGRFQYSSTPVCQWSTIIPPLLARPIGISMACVYIPPYSRLPIVATSLISLILTLSLPISKRHRFRRFVCFRHRIATITQLRLSYQQPFEPYSTQKDGK